jgi:hypothetical protein
MLRTYGISTGLSVTVNVHVLTGAVVAMGGVEWNIMWHVVNFSKQLA